MAYNNFAPMSFPGWYGQQFYQPMQPPIQAQQANNQPQPQAALQTGFIRVPSEDVARNWNVMPGTSVTFINENQPYCYTKTVGFSQLEGSKFEKYRLVKEEDGPVPSDASVGPQNASHGREGVGEGKFPEYALKSDLGALWAAINSLQAKVESSDEMKGVTGDGKSSD